jgi:hypothetical protein
MKILLCVVGALLSVSLLAACAGQGATPSAMSEMTSSGIAPIAKDSAGGPTLYVSEGGGAAIFAGGGATFLRKIRPKAGPIATDQAGHLYIANQTAGAVAVYEDRGAKLAWKVATKRGTVRRLALDHSGDLYENCGARNLCEYGPHNTGLVRQIRGYGSLFALDTAGNLYLVRFGDVAIYAPGQTSPERTITNGISDPGTIAVDPQGNLYVANAYTGSQPSPNIAVYAPGASSPTRTITDGITIAYAMTTDGTGNLYVLNSCINRGGCSNSQNNVAIYSPGSDTPAHVVNGLDFPVTLAVDSSGNLYVANNGSAESDPGSVTVYVSGAYSLIRTVTHNVNNPLYLALSP